MSLSQLTVANFAAVARRPAQKEPLVTARPVRTVLVTGASGAFGAALTTALRQRGVAVAGLDRVAAPGVLACDVTDQDSVHGAVTLALAELGSLDAVVHCAGVGPTVDVGATPAADVREALEVNLLGSWRVTSAALPALVSSPGRGRVVLVSSLLGYLTVPFASAYCVSKRGVLAYGDALRVEYGSALAVTTVLPGYVDTPIHDRSRASGVALDGLVPAEQVSDVVATMVRVLTASRPPRETATTRFGQVGRVIARHWPSAIEQVVIRRARRHLLAGAFGGSALAEAWREREVER